VLAARAARVASPLVVLAATPAARRRLARALHAVGGRAGPLVTGNVASTDAPSTMLLDVASMGADGEMLIECLADDGEPWLLIGAATASDVPPVVRLLLGAPSIEIPALDADAIATAARDTLRAAGEAVTLEADAATWLAALPEAHDPGLLALLLRRALLVAEPGEPIGARHFASTSTPKPRDAEPEVTPSASLAITEARLEYVLAELAHELRNPLVTLKTVADHLDELAGDEALRARFGELARDAVARMDDLLDNLVAYGRLGAPAPRAIELSGLLDAALREAAPALAERGLTVRAAAGSASCLADPEHLGFALRNLLVGIAHTAAPDGELLLDASMNGVVRLRFASDADAATLQSLVAPDAASALYDPAYQPLPFSLARAVLEKGGGRITVAPAIEGGTALEVYLPVSGRPA
jgi:signal transduction histidine kinase